MAAKRKRTRIRVHKGGRPRRGPTEKDTWEAVRRIRQLALVGGVETMPESLRTLLSSGSIDDDMQRDLRLAAAAPEGVVPERAGSPLGILLANGVIDADQHEAGSRFGKLYAMGIGRKAELGFDSGSGAEIDEEALARIERHAALCCAELNRLGSKVRRITEEVCCYGRLRPWLIPDGKTTAGRDDRELLLKGLDKLVELLIGRKARAA